MFALFRHSTSLFHEVTASSHLCRGGRRCLTHVYHSGDYPSFHALGLKEDVLKALADAFPNVQQPTKTQAEFIPAVLSGKDVLLKDQTGSGKCVYPPLHMFTVTKHCCRSLGLLMALLSRPRQYMRNGARGYKATIGCIIIIPHRDLVHQFLYWTKCLHATQRLGGKPESLAQGLTRSSATPIAVQLRALEKNPPHILVGTAQAFFEALKVEDSPLMLRQVKSVIVDEADYLLESPPKKDKYAQMKYLRMLEKHPTATRQILNAIYRVPAKKERDSGYPGLFARLPNGLLKTHLPFRRPQLIFASATLKAAFRHAIMSSSGWFTMEDSDLVKVISHEWDDVAAVIHGGTSIIHSALVVSPSGTISNLKGAVDGPPESAEDSIPGPGQPVFDSSPTLGRLIPNVGEGKSNGHNFYIRV
jgi:hypothetical protein